MKRIRIDKSSVRRQPRCLEVLPLDPRDVEVLRAKAIRQVGERNVTSRHG